MTPALLVVVSGLQSGQQDPGIPEVHLVSHLAELQQHLRAAQ